MMFSTSGCEESIQQRQDDELLSIAAIYPNEVKDLRKNKPWKTWKPLEVLVTLTAHTDSVKEASTQADLYVKCSENYPNSVPFIDIRNTKGLSNKDIADLKAELHSISECRIGQEMLLELIHCTTNFLEDHRKPHYKSFYEEMVHNQLKQQMELEEEKEKEKLAQKLEEEKKLQAIELEKNRKLMELRNANKKPRLPSCSSGDSVDHLSTEHLRPRSHSESSCREVCSGTVRTTLKFNGRKELSVFCGRCLNHNQRGCVIYYGMDTISGDPVIVIKWTLQWHLPHKCKAEDCEAVKREQSVYIKQLSGIEQEFKTLRQLKHESIVRYLGMTYIQKKDKVTIFLLQEYVAGCSLAHMSRGMPLSIQQLQFYTQGVLHAIHYLHENSIVHRNVRETSIFVCSDGHIKLADYSLDKRMYDMYRSLTGEPEMDLYPPTLGKGGKKSDIYRLGLVLLTLSTGHLLKQDLPPKIPHSLNPSFQDFLKKCLAVDEQERWSAEQLLTHPFIAFSSLHSTLPKDLDLKGQEKGNEITTASNKADELRYGSRLLSEFDISDCLGKGGFGHVLKVKNKLDSRVYAIKKIPLNPSNKQLDRKIKREVKLLSRLNHENIVRYYNSWIEETLVPESQDSSSTPAVITNKDSKASTASSVQWEMCDNKEDGLSSDEDDNEDYDTSLVFRQDDCSSDYIVFEEEGTTKPDYMDSESSFRQIKPAEHTRQKVQRFMYIQMEFCEKSTLRTAIDNGLCKDVPLVWRLFREIIEGLNHIHQQGVIHRDLKPVNIFLDSKEHVKIGDFGLATDVISKTIPFDVAVSGGLHFYDQFQHSLSDTTEDGFRTGNVGTALYVAPEIASSSPKITYNQKVDIYSLGIIFFEMCYPPPSTAMERVKLIMNLRQHDIILPCDVNARLTPDMVSILKWLLQHDVSKRPTSAELIASDYIPPLLIEETELHNILRNTVSNPQSRTYKYMINCLFNQEVSTEFDFTYDMDIYKGLSIRNKPTQVFSDVVDTLNRVLRKHGAVSYSVPTLMPKSSLHGSDTCVCLMDHGGGMISLPHDLRVPFARHVARKEINQLKRFTVEKVYREQKVFGCHPREQYEYAFDIVTPSSCSFMPDAEVLCAVSEIISEFPSLEERNYFICVNHCSLLKAVMMYSGVEHCVEEVVCSVLGDQKNRSSSKLQLQHQLLEHKIPEKVVAKLSQFLDVADPFDKAANLVQCLNQTKGEVGVLTKKSLKELKAIITLAEAFGVKLPIYVCPTLAHEAKLYSGMFFQVMCYLKLKKKKQVIDILAAGGRYDKLISSFKLKTLSEGKGVSQSAVGISIAVERIVAAEMEYSEQPNGGTVDFLIYSVDSDMLQEKSALLKDLWSLGCRATVYYSRQMNLDDAVDFCRNNSIPHLMILHSSEPGMIKIRSFDREKISEKKVCNSELKELLFKLSNSLRSSVECSQPARSEIQRSFSVQSCNVSLPAMSVRFLSQDKTHNNRKREPNIRSHVLSVLQPSTNRVWEIIAVDLKLHIISSLVSFCDVSANDYSLHQSFLSVIDMHSKYKKYLLQLEEEICDAKNKKQQCAIVLYSLPDTNFRVIL